VWVGGELFLLWGGGDHIILHGVIQVSDFVLTSQKTIKDTVFPNLIICGPPKALIGGEVRVTDSLKTKVSTCLSPVT
jgi:hypothetical protein